MRLSAVSSLDITKKKRNRHSRNQDSEYWTIYNLDNFTTNELTVLYALKVFLCEHTRKCVSELTKVKGEEKILATRDQPSQKHLWLIVSQYF